ncbi:MAG: hypothetical protein PF447_04035 [Spirochaetaceae bacterium]|jgi:hypothetical protein|nr:hypothetical protein [Spirochaetaceae bacterium]
MDSREYIIKLKRKQLNLMRDYQNFLNEQLEVAGNFKNNYYKNFREVEQGYIGKLEHLNKVIASFPETPEILLDKNIWNTYEHVKILLDKMMDQLSQKRKDLKLKEKAYLLKDNRQKRLYRDLKPAYIDIRT